MQIKYSANSNSLSFIYLFLKKLKKLFVFFFYATANYIGSSLFIALSAVASEIGILDNFNLLILAFDALLQKGYGLGTVYFSLIDTNIF